MSHIHKDILFSCLASAVPVDGGGAGLFSTQLWIPVLGCVLVVVAKLCLCQECTQLLGLLRAHTQVTVMEVLLHVRKENVSTGQKKRRNKNFSTLNSALVEILFYLFKKKKLYLNNQWLKKNKQRDSFITFDIVMQNQLPCVILKSPRHVRAGGHCKA